MKAKQIVIGLMALAIIAPVQNADAAFWNKKKKAKAAAAAQKDTTKKAKTTSYDKLLKGAVAAKGDFVNLYKKEGKVYMEYKKENLGRRILAGGTVSGTSDPTYTNIGMRYSDPVELIPVKRDSSIAFERVNIKAVPKAGDEAMKLAYERSYTDELFALCPIKAVSNDSSSYVIDITDLIKDLAPSGSNLGAPRKGINGLKDQSYFGGLKSFKDNASVEYVRNVMVQQAILIFIMRLGELTLSSNISFVLLPEEQMKPRIQDTRVGVFSTMGNYLSIVSPKYELSTDKDGLRPFMLANRWKLEPVDSTAWLAGQTVEVKKPIVWYVDNTFPADWVPVVKDAILTWNKAFEKIGLKNVMQVRDFPTAEEDPEFDPDNLKYTCIRYVPNATRNAMGPSWVDPRTGEILNASVYIYNDIVRLINNWRFIQTAQVDPSVRATKMPKAIRDASLKYVVSHEIGHTLGLMHNMGASTAYPVDSLRSASFTQKYGVTPSIMDYARYNYVAQPGDAGLKLDAPELGVYDYYAIDWLYRPVYGAKDMWDEYEKASKIIDEHAGDPMYRYGVQQIQYGSYGSYDPRALTEDIGDDHIKAGDYGVKNLKYITENVDNWITDDPDYSYKQSLYTEIANQYYRYIGHTLSNVGGIYLNEVKEGTSDEKRVEAVPKSLQSESLAWVIDRVRDMNWLDDAEFVQKLPLHADYSETIAATVSKDLLSTVLNRVAVSAQVASKTGNAYTQADFFDDLYKDLFKTTISGGKLSGGEKKLMRDVVEELSKGLISQKRNPKTTITLFADDTPISSDFSDLPSYEELVFTGKIPAEWLDKYGKEFETVEAQYGKGAVAALLSSDNSIGESKYPYHRYISPKNILERNEQGLAFVRKANTLLSSRRTSGNKDDRAFYGYLYSMTSEAIK